MEDHYVRPTGWTVDDSHIGSAHRKAHGLTLRGVEDRVEDRKRLRHGFLKLRLADAQRNVQQAPAGLLGRQVPEGLRGLQHPVRKAPQAALCGCCACVRLCAASSWPHGPRSYRLKGKSFASLSLESPRTISNHRASRKSEHRSMANSE